MAYLVKALAGRWKSAPDLVAALLIVAGGALVIGACVFRVFVHPEWTFDEALKALAPFLAAGVVSLISGWLLDRRERR
jgi:predicted lysophospholipase L1 biosynthesis ABC-type transport system permease subunit